MAEPTEARTEARVFPNGSAWADWEGTNCWHCQRSGLHEDGEYDWHRCLLQDAISGAYIGDGRIAQATALRIWPAGEWGYEPCAERQDGTPPGVPVEPIPEDVAMRRAGMAELPLFEEVAR